MVFIVLEGFSGTGKTSLAKMLERDGWLRITESAHSLPPDIPLADRADTYSDYALLGQVLTSTPQIRRLRSRRRVVAEGYFLSDLAYFKIRQTLRLSNAFPSIYRLVSEIMKDQTLAPDLYILLEADSGEIGRRQARKRARDRNESTYFFEKYYEFIKEFHKALNQPNYTVVHSHSRTSQTYRQIRNILTLKELL